MTNVYEQNERHQLDAFERRIEDWPKKWGKTLQFVIISDLVNIPQDKLHFDSLGITMLGSVPQKSTDMAYCRTTACIDVFERSADGINEAVKRINVLVGILFLESLGNARVGWYCGLIDGCFGRGSLGECDFERVNVASNRVLNLPPSLRKRICQTLFWIRAGGHPADREEFGREVLRTYVYNWNAFEGLVHAICSVRPLAKRDHSEKQQAIHCAIARGNGSLTPKNLARLYRLVVEPGFRVLAEHAINVSLSRDADLVNKECFELLPKSDRLYAIRNAINHGDIDAECYSTLARLRAREGVLREIVTRMLYSTIGTPAFAHATDSKRSTYSGG